MVEMLGQGDLLTEVSRWGGGSICRGRAVDCATLVFV